MSEASKTPVLGSLCQLRRDTALSYGVVPEGTNCIVIEIDKELTRDYERQKRSSKFAVKDTSYRFTVFLNTQHRGSRETHVLAEEIEMIDLFE